MIEASGEIESIEGYWSAGGKLNSASFEVAIKKRQILNQILSTGLTTLLASDSSLAQVENMAIWGKVTITPEQKYLYGVLADMKAPKGYEAPANQRFVSVWSLSDRALLAEVFLLTGDLEKRRMFMKKYPNIFGGV